MKDAHEATAATPNQLKTEDKQDGGAPGDFGDVELQKDMPPAQGSFAQMPEREGSDEL